ncbi:MAG: ubiquinol-cytochrome c reductase iron-sulfur subunit [Bdellovibrionales bacterium]|nr:ubiquinol-cytochrome c reductase iron-sulfur subunit [Ramlibacter sp.]
MSADGISEGAIDGISATEATRRRHWVQAAGTMGGVGLLAAAYPFVASLSPSEKAKAQGGPVIADIAALLPGTLMTVAWRGKPVWLMRRTPSMVSALLKPDAALVDPMSKRSEQPVACSNATRSLRADVFVAVAVCTHLGCTPILQLNNAALNAELDAPGGFLCPCHGSRFDLAGRVVKNVPAPINLEIPVHSFLSPTSVQIG